MRQTLHRYIFMLLFFLVAFDLHAKDVITRCDGEEIEVFVTEVGQNEVRYKKYNNPEGPAYVVGKSELFSIKYNVNTPEESKEMFLCTEPAAEAEILPAPNYPSHYNVSRKEPAAALLFSFILPGGGQYYNGQYGKGAIMTGAALVSLVGMVASAANNTSYYGADYGNDYYYSDNSDAVAFWLLAYVGIYVWSMTDAVVSARKINRNNGFASWKVGKGTLLSLSPDMNFNNPSRSGSVQKLSPSLGMGVKLSF